MRHIKIERKNLNDICTMVFLYAMQLHFWLAGVEFENHSITEMFRTSCFAVALVVVGVKWIFNRTVVGKKFLAYSIVTILVMYEAYVSSGLTVIKMLLFGLIVKDTPYRKVARYFSQINVFIFLFVFSLIWLGKIPNRIFIDNGERYYYMGFGNPNTAAMLYLVILLTITSMRMYSLNIGHFIAIVVMSAVMYTLTGSRSMLIVTVIYFILIFVERYFSFIKRISRKNAFKVIMYSLFLVLTGLSFFLAKLYSTSRIVQSLNILFSWRFYLWHRFVSDEKISLLGINMEDNIYTIDNGYLILLVGYGIIVWLIYMGINFYLINSALKNGQIEILILTIIYMIYLFVEQYPIMINTNLALLYFLCVFWQNSKLGKENLRKCIT